jgi:hypothetical protein
MKNVTFTTQRSISRRAMLKGAGITLALPWLDAMSAAFAADPKPPMRFIGILNYFSFHAPNLFPKEAGANYIATPYLEGLQPHRKEFTIISGLNHPEVRDGHASDKSFFTGAPHPGSPSFKNTISLDQLMAKTAGNETRMRYLALTNGGFSGDSLAWSSTGVNIPAEKSPARLFQQLFLDGTPAEMAPINKPGVVLSQPPISTAPSMGWLRISSSVSMANILRYSMVVGRTKASANEMAGNSNGKPPA